MKALVEIKNLSFKYPDQNEFTLKDISFQVNAGESMGILGPNGGGKSTLMKILSGLIKPSSGEILINGIKILNRREFPRKIISYVPQSVGINTSLPIKAMEYLKYAGTSLEIANLDERIKIVSQIVGIDSKLDYQFREMSGGEMQRVLLCKSLLNEPQILLLDEPSKGLDSLGQDQLLEVLLDIKTNNNTAVIIVDHNINQLIRHCDKVLCLNKTSHWHNHKELLTKSVLENIYHCEFEHLLIHESDKEKGQNHEHLFCNHNHNEADKSKSHQFIRRKN